MIDEYVPKADKTSEYIIDNFHSTEKKYIKLSGCRYISKDEYARIMQPTALTQLRVNNQYWLKKREEVADYLVRTVGVILACLFLIFILPNICKKEYERHVYNRCLEISQNYIDNTEYKKAIKSLEKGLELETKDTTEIIIKLGYLYACLNKYDEGIAFLEEEYRKSNNPDVYTQLEALKRDKAIEEYSKYLSIADDANRSITEDDRLNAYTKAIDAKPDESKAYMLVSNIYVNRGDYDRAINILSSGVEACENISGIVARETINVLKSEIQRIDKILNSTEYNQKYLEVCKAYLQGNLENAIVKYKEAKAINHRDYRLYVVMSNTYTNKNRYDDAIAILNEGIKTLSVYKNNTLMVDKYKYLVNLRTKIGTIKKYVNNYKSYYRNLYNSCGKMTQTKDVTSLEKILCEKMYSTVASSNNVTYYNYLGRFVDNHTNGMGLAVYKNKYLYYGNWKNGKKHGFGYYIASKKSGGTITTYVYSGTWVNGYPNGRGSVVYKVRKGKSVIYRTKTVGTFKNGYEHGKMIIEKYDKASYGKKILKLVYTANNGVIQYLKDKNGKVSKTSSGYNIIGYYYVGNKKSEVVATKNALVWKVNGLGL